MKSIQIHLCSITFLVPLSMHIKYPDLLTDLFAFLFRSRVSRSDHLFSGLLIRASPFHAGLGLKIFLEMEQ